MIEVVAIKPPETFDPNDLKTLKPQRKVIWKNPDFDDYKPDNIDYHGTDITRARDAFPEIADELKCPKGYL